MTVRPTAGQTATAAATDTRETSVTQHRRRWPVTMGARDTATRTGGGNGIELAASVRARDARAMESEKERRGGASGDGSNAGERR